MLKVNYVKKARKDFFDENNEIIISRGDSYYWWQHAFHPVTRSLTRPQAKDLTLSLFKISVYEVEETMTKITKDNFPTYRYKVLGRLSSILEKEQNKLNNMPEGLRKSEKNGLVIKNRVNNLKIWMEELEDKMNYKEFVEIKYNEVRPIK